jgi:hypothetical protein
LLHCVNLRRRSKIALRLRRRCRQRRAFFWVNTAVANLSTAIKATYKASSPKHLPGYLGAFCWTTNHRKNMRSMISAACRAIATSTALTRKTVYAPAVGTMVGRRDFIGLGHIVAADMPEANEMVVGIMAVVARAERKMISARTKAALQAAKGRGIKLGGLRHR